VQIAVCVMLLATAALATRSLQRTRTLDVGFVPAGVVHTSADLIRHGYSEASAAELHRQLIARVRALPEVRDVALTTHVPLTGGVRRVALMPEGHDPANPVMCTLTSISHGYFRTLGIRFVAGRDFSEEETSGSAPVAIISTALARRFWPGGQALGRRVTVGDAEVPVTIVGVVRDAADASMWREKGISLYVPAGAGATRHLRLVVRTDGDAQALASLLRAEARRIDSRLRVDAEPLDEVLALWMLPSRVAAIAGSVLGAIALAIAAVGIYGVLAYGMAQRRREIAIRVALGATGGDVRTLLLSDGGRLIATGLIAGAVGAMVMMRAIAAVLPGAVPADPVGLAVALVVLTIAALCACYLPARSAAKWDPLPALRNE
jgi:predicted permease